MNYMILVASIRRGEPNFDCPVDLISARVLDNGSVDVVFVQHHGPTGEEYLQSLVLPNKEKEVSATLEHLPFQKEKGRGIHYAEDIWYATREELEAAFEQIPEAKYVKWVRG